MKKHQVRAKFIFLSSCEILKEDVSEIPVLGFRFVRNPEVKGAVSAVPAARRS